MLSQRLKTLPKYLFVKIEEKKRLLIEKGYNVLDFGIGDPDIPPPTAIIECLIKYAKTAPCGYPPGEGIKVLREAICDFYKRKYGVALDAEKEVLPLIGSKEGIAHLPFALIDTGDVVIVPDPAYPVYEASSHLAGARVERAPLLAENDFLPDFSSFSSSLLNKTKIVYLNYPNNPTGAIAKKEFFQDVINLAEKWGFLICHDAAYAQIVFEGRPFSILECEGAKECVIEFGSLSKSYSMAGWRIGFAVGASWIIEALRKVKSNIDSGIPWAVQYAASFALSKECDDFVNEIVEEYKRRLLFFSNGLKKMGFSLKEPIATFYLWLPLPEGKSSEEFCTRLAEEAHVIATPGVGFGRYGEGYVRFALTKQMSVLEEALKRMEKCFG